MHKRQSVVLITIDSIRYDRCGFAGNESVSTPTLDEMARHGFNFRNAIAPGSATPDSVPVTLTGEFPPLKTSNANLDRWVRNQVGARRTIAERFSAKGYSTGAFTANPWASRYFGFDKGFDHFEDFFTDDGSKGILSEAISDSSVVMEIARNVNDWLAGQNMFMSWEAYYDDIIEWTREAESPYFLWLFLVDAHVPYYAGAEYRTQSKFLLIPANLWLFFSGLHDIIAPFDEVLWEAYDNCIRHTDEFLRRLRRDVSDDDPLIAVYGDHGDEFGEFGRYGHGGGLSEPLIHVPFVLENSLNASIDDLVSLTSIPDLLIGFATEDISIEEVARRWSKQVIVSWIGQSVSVRAQTWKYVYDSADDSGEMYRIDPDGIAEELWENPPQRLVDGAVQLAQSAYQDRLEKKRIVDAVEDLVEKGDI